MPRKVSCKRNQNGGGLGAGWGFTQAAPEAPLVNNELQYTAISQCREAARPGYLDGGYTGPKGIPGLSGGGRRRGGKSKKANRKGGRKSNRKTRKGKKQSGGRYGIGEFDGAGMGTPWGSGLAPTAHVPCEASRTAIPDSGAAGTLNRIGGPLWDGPAKSEMLGGAYAAVADASNSLGLTQPTAGYSHLKGPADIIVTAAGTYEMVNIPENARVMNQACLKTGGARRGRGRGRKSSRKGRKANRKSSRKSSRKASHRK